MLLGLRSAIYAAPDMDRAKAWYTELLGIAPYFDSPEYVGFSVGGFELGLYLFAAPGTNGPNTYWGVPDVDAAHARLLDLGATENGPIADVGEGIRLVTVLDPFGNQLGVIENPNFSPAAVR